MNCKNCNTEINAKFCPECGQATSLKRIDRKYIIHEIEHVLHFERGILYTIKELLINPGPNIRTYLSENRSRLVKPIIFIIITSLIYSLTINYFHIEEKYVEFRGDKIQNLAVFKIFKWVEGHYGYANIIMGIFITAWLKIFFRKFLYNFFEILILLCFVMGISMLILSLFGVLQGIFHINFINIGGIAGALYCSWAIGHFFGKQKLINYVKAFFAYVLGMITFSIVALLLGLLIDIITKH